jgi:hypothetical protein
MPSVLILGGRAPVALDHARRFKRLGWAVRIADSIPCRLSGWSNSVVETILIAPPRYAPHKFAEDLSRIISQHAIDLVVPTCEEVFYLSRYRHLLPKQVRIVVDNFETLRSLHSKWQFLKLARDCGANVPQSYRVNTIAEARDCSRGLPFVLKPEFSRFGVHVRLYPEGVPKDAAKLEIAAPWVAQRFHAGKEYCSYSIADAGRLLSHVMYQPSYRIHRSSSYYFEPHQSKIVESFVANFVCKMNFTGQISFDWIEGDDGSMTVLECNPRAISGLHLFAADDDVPSALTGQRDDCIVPSHQTPGMIAAIMLTAGLRSAVANLSFNQWRCDYQRANDVISCAGDRKALLGAVMDLGSYSRIAITQRCNLREASTRDIEWDGEELLSP